LSIICSKQRQKYLVFIETAHKLFYDPLKCKLGQHLLVLRTLLTSILSVPSPLGAVGDGAPILEWLDNNQKLETEL